MFWSLLASNFLNQCSANISYLNHNNWIGITALVVLTFMMVGAAAYGFSGIFPTNMREKIRGSVRYEYVQGVFSLVLIAAVFSVSLTACSVEGYITSSATKFGGPTLGVTPACGMSYTDPFQFSNCYVGNLLFSKGTTLISDMIAEGFLLFTEGNLLFFAVNSAAQVLSIGSGAGTLSTFFGTISGGLGVSPSISNSEGPAEIFYDYSFILVYVFEAIIVATFGLLFLLFLGLSFIEMLSLTVVLPVAIAMRCISFAGPKLREASNAFIAIAIAFYFVFPVTIAMNYYIVNWTYCTNGGACNPYAQSYLGTYTLSTLPLINLFTNPETVALGSGTGVGGINLALPLNFYGAVLQSNGGLLNTVKNMLFAAAALPNVMNNYTEETAQFVFQGIFLIALDIAITVGFSVGFFKGLETVGQIMAVGPVWSG